MVRGFIVVLLALAFATPAHAALTTAESAQVNSLVVNVISPLNAALSELSFAVRGQQDRPDVLRPAVEHTKEAIREAHLALALLVNVVPGAEFVMPDPSTRATRVAEAWFHLDRVALFAGWAQGDMLAGAGLNTVRARTIWLPAALAWTRQIDRGLAYTDPSPVSFPAIIGPHGDYNRTVWQLYRANWYVLDTLEYTFPFYGSRTADWYTLVNRAPIFYDTYARLIALMAGVVVPPGDASLSQFWRVLGAQASLTDFHQQGLSLRYTEIMDAITLAPAPEFRLPYLRVVDSWKQMDQAVWEMLVFLNCSASSDPQGCARGQAPAPSPFVPAPSPDPIVQPVPEPAPTPIVQPVPEPAPTPIVQPVPEPTPIFIAPIVPLQ